MLVLISGCGKLSNIRNTDVSVKCGNSVCETTSGENVGNCIQDCPPIKGCNSNDDCRQGEVCSTQTDPKDNVCVQGGGGQQ